MKLLINGWAVSNRGGIGRYTRNLVAALADSRIASNTILVAPKYDTKIELETVVVEQSRLNRLWYEFVFLPELCSKVKPDVILCPDFVTCRYNKSKRVTVVHDLSPILLPDSVSWRARVLFHNGIKNTVKTADLILADSIYTKQSIMSTFANLQNNPEVIYPPLEPVYLNSPSPLDFSARSNEIIWVGDNGIRKDVLTLIKSMDLFIKQHPDYRLVYVGPIDKKFAGIPWITHKQDISDHELIQHYRRAKCLVNTSILEGFGYPVAEALSQGTPCVVTDNSSMPEISDVGVSKFEVGNVVECSNLIASTVNPNQVDTTIIANTLKTKGYDYTTFSNRMLELISTIL